MKSTTSQLDGQGILDLGLPEIDAPAELAWPATGELAPGLGPLPAASLDGFATSLFVQAYADEMRDAARLVEYTRVGAVYTIRRGRTLSHLHQAIAAVDVTQRRTRSSTILIDRNLYSGRNRKQAVDGLDRQWVDQQFNILRLPWAMTDSGFIATMADLTRVLHDAETMNERVIVALPMAHELIRDNASDVADQVRQQGHPVAVMLGHAADPFDEPAVPTGMVHLIREADRPVLQLRCDTSAVGLISHGAVVGAVGTHSGLRHIYPVTKRKGRGPFGEELAFVIPEFLGYYRQKRFEPAYLRDPGQHVWWCPCFFCASRDLTWIGNQPKELKFRAAFQHSVAALARIGGELELAGARIGRPQAWASMCGTAIRTLSAAENPSGSSWEPKPALRNWSTLLPTKTLSQ